MKTVEGWRKAWWVLVLTAVFYAFAGFAARADTWALPEMKTNRSENALYELIVVPVDLEGGFTRSSAPSAIFRKKEGAEWKEVWKRPLVNRIAPVRAIVADTGRYVVTFDEWHSVGQKPVVIYGPAGRLVAELTLTNLNLQNDPNIVHSVSSYWWNEHAIEVFGPPARAGQPTWAGMLEDSLFIRLHWGRVIAIDLASGRVRDEAWWNGLPPDDRRNLKTATDEFLDATWQRLAGEYFRPENFVPNLTERGMKGLLLSAQLRRHEALPLMRKIAATERFQHWSAPASNRRFDSNLRTRAQDAVAEIERVHKTGN